MAHLLPPAGISPIRKGDQFRFCKVIPGLDDDCGFCDDIPLNIHDFRWTNYEEEDKLFREAKEAKKRNFETLGPKETAQRSANQNYLLQEFRPPVEGQFSPYQSEEEQYGMRSGAYHHFGGQMATCPPINVDPRSLIRSRNKAAPDSQRPTGY